MSTSAFPSSLDDFTNPLADQVLGDPAALHHSQHGLANDALASIEQRVGLLGSADSTSLDYQARNRTALAFFLGS
jgi:hypothetical protein